MKKPLTLLCLLCYALCAFSQQNNFSVHDINFPKSFNNQIITCVEQDNAGLLWLVTHSGLYRYDGNEIIHFKNGNKPPSWNNSINTILSARKNNLWIGTKEGLIRLDLHSWTTTTIKTKLPAISNPQSHNIVAIGQGTDGTIYAGSIDGKLYRVVNDSLALILDVNQTNRIQYGSPSITFIAAPYPGQIWLGTSFGKLICIKENNGQFGPPEYFGMEKFHGEPIDEASFHSLEKCLVDVPHHGLYILNTHTGAWKKIPGKYENLGKDGQVYIESFGKDKALLFTNQPSIGKSKLFIYNFQTDSITEQILHFPPYLKDNHRSRSGLENSSDGLPFSGFFLI